LLGGALRFEIIAQSIEGFGEIAMLPGRPSLERGEKSMLDGVSRDARLALDAARTSRARGIAPISLDTPGAER
jgi:hypothetical protein